jgi:hypothetical protein
MNEQQYKNYQLAVQRSDDLAGEAVLALNLPQQINLSVDDVKCTFLNERLTQRIESMLENLTEKHGEKFPYLIALGLKESWLAAYAGAFYFSEMIRLGEMLDNARTRKMATPLGYVDSEGWAYTLDNSLANLNEKTAQINFRKNTLIFERPSSIEILNCMCVYWFSRAVLATRSGNTLNASNWFYESQDAFTTAHGLFMWDAAIEHEKEETSALDLPKNIRSELARNAALARHSENHQMKREVFIWLDSNMKDMKMDQAAAVIAGKIVPMTFRTVRDWVAEWKKQRSASTP